MRTQSGQALVGVVVHGLPRRLARERAGARAVAHILAGIEELVIAAITGPIRSSLLPLCQTIPTG